MYRTIHEETLPEGDDGTARTVAYMGALAHEGAQSPEVRELLGPTPRGWWLIHCRIRDLLRRIRFEYDPPGLELVLHPTRMARDLAAGVASGDCDCIATLGAALCLAAGLPVRFVTVAPHPAADFTHVYAETPLGELDVVGDLQGVVNMRRRREWGWL